MVFQKMELGGAYFYGIDVFLDSNRTYVDPEFDIEIIDSGNNTLTVAVNQALADLAASGESQYVYLNGDDAIEIIDNLNPDETVSEFSLCVPQPSGFIVTTRNPDPQVINASLSATELPLGDEVSTTTVDEPISDAEKDQLVEKNLRLDITDPNIFFSKSVEPITAFPGEVVTYTISIENLTSEDILVQDVWDDNIGVGQRFFDYDGDPGTLPSHLEFQTDGQSSIEFDSLQSPTSDLGWSWDNTRCYPCECNRDLSLSTRNHEF